MAVASLDKQRQIIDDAFHSQFGRNDNAPTVVDDWGYMAIPGWVVDTFEDYLIASFGSDYFKIYFDQKGDEITFSEREVWLPVEEKREFNEWILEEKTPEGRARRATEALGKLRSVKLARG